MTLPAPNTTPPVIAAAKKYADNNWAVAPVPNGEKGPKFQGWQQKKITSGDVEAYFDDPEGNVAVVMGALSGKLIDIDIDCPEGLSIAPQLLPETSLIFGREGNPASHRIYQCDDKSPATEKFTDTDGSVLIELRSDGHATNFPPSMHPSGEFYEFEEEGEPGTVSAANLSSAVRLVATACLCERHWPDKGARHEAALAVSGVLARAGYEKAEVVNAVGLIAKFAGDEEIEDRKTTASDTCENFAKGVTVSGVMKLHEVFGDKVAGKLEKWLNQSQQDELAEKIAGYNEKHAVTMSGGKCRIMNMETDPDTGWPTINFSTKHDFLLRHAPEKVSVGYTQTGEPKHKNLACVWLDSEKRREFDGVVFRPGAEVPGYFNLWGGFAVEPIKGDCDLFFEHLYQIVCAGDDDVFLWLVGWMADAVQNPASRPGTAVVLRGEQGTGKSITCNYFGGLFGPHYKVVTHSKHLIGQFNGHLQDALIVVADEAFWAGEKSAEGVLKDLVTGDTIRIERKHMDVQIAPNFIRLIVTSNHDWVVPAGPEERRFLTVDLSDEKMQDKAYFAALADEMDNGGREALLFLLQHHDYSDIDLRTIPKTNALFEQKLHSMTPFQKYWFETLSKGYIGDGPAWPKCLRTEEFREHYYQFASGIGVKHKDTDTQIGISLKKLCPEVGKGKKTLPVYLGDGATAILTSQQLVYVFLDLETCRTLLEQYIGSELPWPE